MFSAGSGWSAASIPCRRGRRQLALPLLAGGIGAALLLPGILPIPLALLVMACFGAAAFRALTEAERRDARGLLRRPWRLRAVLRGESA
jgi:hypothetical protein